MGPAPKAWEGEGRCAIINTCEVQTENQLPAHDHSAANRRLRKAGSGPAFRNRQLGGVKFARQVPIGPFFADFCCRDAKLVIEIDGVTHETPEELARDARRTAWLEAQGYRVIRFRNEELMGDLDAVLQRIQLSL